MVLKESTTRVGLDLADRSSGTSRSARTDWKSPPRIRRSGARGRGPEVPFPESRKNESLMRERVRDLNKKHQKALRCSKYL